MAAESPDTAPEVGDRAAGVLAPESDLFEDLDASGFGAALAAALRANLSARSRRSARRVRLATALARIPMVATARWLGRDVEPPVPVDPKDRRFADPAWSANPAFYSVRLAYLAAVPARASRRRRLTSGDETGRKAALAVDLLLDAVAPTNFLPTNPAALKRAFDTGGRQPGSRVSANFLDDLVNNDGRPRQVDTSGVRGRREPGGDAVARSSTATS